jgi:hypothetical protein
VQRFGCDSVSLTKNKIKNLKHTDMKTLAKTLFAVAITAAVLSSTGLTAFASEPVSSTTMNVKLSTVNRIWVSGNVKLVLTQGKTQGVTETENYDATKTSISTNGKTMFINSEETNEVVIKLTLKDLERIEAYGGSVVVTNNNFDVNNLQLFISQGANANIKTTAKSLYMVVKEEAVVKLNGTAVHSTLIASNMKNVRMNNFACMKSESYASEALFNAPQTAVLAK